VQNFDFSGHMILVDTNIWIYKAACNTKIGQNFNLNIGPQGKFFQSAENSIAQITNKGNKLCITDSIKIELENTIIGFTENFEYSRQFNKIQRRAWVSQIINKLKYTYFPKYHISIYGLSSPQLTHQKLSKIEAFYRQFEAKLRLITQRKINNEYYHGTPGILN